MLQDDSFHKEIEAAASTSTPFLLVIQTPQQQKWMVEFGNTITCMDAIYRWTMHALYSSQVIKIHPTICTPLYIQD